MNAWPDERVALFARTDFRNQRRAFGIRQADRRSHMYILGQTGTGKSTLIETIIRQDIGADQGAMLLDPHGDLVERVSKAVPERRKQDVIYWDVADPNSTIGFNPLSSVAPAKRPLMASFVLEAFKKLWPDFWGPRLEHVFRHALLALLDQPTATLADVLRLFEDAEFRKRVGIGTGNAAVRHFWLEEFERYPTRLRAEAIAPIQNKVGAFLAHPTLQQIVTHPHSSFDLRTIMDEGKVLLVNLARGRLGEDAASLLGSLLVSAVGMAALSRTDEPEHERRDFFVFLDEFQGFTTRALASLLPELRKYRVCLALAHQHLAQVDHDVREAILGNVGTLICFRLGPTDAALLYPYFAPKIRACDLIMLANYRIYVQLLIRGTKSSGFSAASSRISGPFSPSES